MSFKFLSFAASQHSHMRGVAGLTLGPLSFPDGKSTITFRLPPFSAGT